MQNRLRPIIQAVALVIVPMVVIFIINYLFSALGRGNSSSITNTSLKMSIFVIPNALFIILHKYKLSYLAFVVAVIASFLAVQGLGSNELEVFSKFSLYLINFINFALLIGVTYFAYFVINGFKLKNIVFIIGGIIAHTISVLGLFLLNKQEINIELVRAVIYTASNRYLMIGLVLAIGLLLFELPIQVQEVNTDDEDDDL